MWNLAEVLGTLVFSNCSIEPQLGKVYKVTLGQVRDSTPHMRLHGTLGGRDMSCSACHWK